MSGVNTSCKTNEISSHPLGKKKKINKYEMLARKKISPSDSPKSYSMFLSPITVQESSDWFLNDSATSSGGNSHCWRTGGDSRSRD